MSKGSKRRREDAQKVRDNWDMIMWKSAPKCSEIRVDTNLPKELEELVEWLDDNDIMKEQS